MRAQSHRRSYHSVAFLLLDGRVVSAGGVAPDSQEHSVEIFSPPYLFQGPRPSIVGAPGSIDYLASGTGSTIFVTVEEGVAGDGPAKVSLVRPSSVTHAFDFDQRYVELLIDSSTLAYPPPPAPPTYQVEVVKPEDSKICPPGWYILFVVSSNGIPSVGRFIHVQ